MKQDKLKSLQVEIPALEITSEGQLRGGFTMLGPERTPKDGKNNDCSNNSSCKGNDNCHDNGSCNNNWDCICSAVANPTCGLTPDPGAKNPNCA